MDHQNFPDETFNFEKECQEFIDLNFVHSIKFHEIIPGISSTLTIQTLEDHVLELEWDSYGIRVLTSKKANGEDIPPSDKKFEDLYGLLNTYSEKYLETFHNQLSMRLMNDLNGLDRLRFFEDVDNFVEDQSNEGKDTQELNIKISKSENQE
ncbi:UNKNOWN [Stylonychia lemnae]|uniref:GSKIP domain-containing protein n=1 Tax=Stylonychia lemnae TaxID=5949 RepID=A0A078B9E3_STYLE|nr:UNKNOWN [Stylonychia lemnae]|eukprot:CDW91145.1 UNKNOWN [Stylonychia lemnae]